MRPASRKKSEDAKDTGLQLLLWPVLAAIVFGLIGFGEVLEDALRIARDGVRSHAVSGDTVLVEVDDASLREVGSWPCTGKLESCPPSASGKLTIFDPWQDKFREGLTNRSALSQAL